MFTQGFMQCRYGSISSKLQSDANGQLDVTSQTRLVLVPVQVSDLVRGHVPIPTTPALYAPTRDSQTWHRTKGICEDFVCVFNISDSVPCIAVSWPGGRGRGCLLTGYHGDWRALFRTLTFHITVIGCDTVPITLIFCAESMPQWHQNSIRPFLYWISMRQRGFQLFMQILLQCLVAHDHQQSQT